MRELETARAAKRPPLLELFRGPGSRPLIQVVVLMTGMWFASQMTVSFQPVVLLTVLHQDPSNVSWFLVISSICTGLGMVGYGALSQRTGRRALLRGVSISVIVIGTLAWLFMVRFAENGSPFVAIAVMAAIASFVTNAPLGVFVVYLNERFGTAVRSAGYSTAYTFGLILPGLYTVWVKTLDNIVPFAYTAMFLIPLGGVLVFAAMQLGPETRDVDLLHHEPPPLQTRRRARPAHATGAGRYGGHAVNSGEDSYHGASDHSGAARESDGRLTPAPPPVVRTVYEPPRETPVHAECDVLVVGGGPSGCAAALAARRLGASVVLVERYNHLGGLSTAGSSSGSTG